jgi:hypothetical protein
MSDRLIHINVKSLRLSANLSNSTKPSSRKHGDGSSDPHILHGYPAYKKMIK